MYHMCDVIFFFFSSRRRHTRLQGDWSSDVCSSDLIYGVSDPDRYNILTKKTKAFFGEENAKKIQKYFFSEIKSINEQMKDRKSTRLNSSHLVISYAVFCLKKKTGQHSPLPLYYYIC